MGTHYKGTQSEELSLNAYIKLSRVFDTINSSLLRSLKCQGLTVSQLGVLEAILHLGPMSQREMGDKLLMSRANITTVVDNLERDGLVKRVASKEDRRVYMLHMTPKGKELISDAFPKHVAEIERLMTNLDSRELEQLASLCKKLGLGIKSNPTVC